MTILYIILFILSFSVLIVVHELGHLSAAKIFKVFCFDFSIGFGPSFVHKKRKNGETYFSLRVIPFGGYVSMYGEEGENEIEGVEIPKERSIEGVAKWKKFIIMSAGVIMNMILALILFYSSAQFFPSQMIYIDSFEVTQDTPAYASGIRDNDVLSYIDLSEEQQKEYEGLGISYFIDLDAKVFTTDNNIEPKPAIVGISTSNISPKNLDLNNFIKVYANVDNQYTDILNYQNIDYVEFKMPIHHYDENKNTYDEEVDFIDIKLDVINASNDGETSHLTPLGMSFRMYTHHNSYSEAVVKTFKDFGDSSSLIFRSVINLFMGKGWEDVGGPVAIYGATTSILQDYGVGQFLYIWGVISVNLAIINLLPFPGLDGWHLLVVLIEGISRKKVPNKVKNIVSTIGLILLFGLMIVILLKDIVGLF